MASDVLSAELRAVAREITLGARDLATRLHIPITAVYMRIGADLPDCVKINGRWQWKLADVEAWERRNVLQARVDAGVEAARNVWFGRSIPRGHGIRVMVDENEKRIAGTYGAHKIRYCLRDPKGARFAINSEELVSWGLRFFGKPRASRSGLNMRVVLRNEYWDPARTFRRTPVVDSSGELVGFAAVGDWTVLNSEGDDLLIPQGQALAALDALTFVQDGNRSYCVYTKYRKEAS